MVMLHNNNGAIKHYKKGVCLTAAIGLDRVHAMQVVEGAMDAVLFENFVYQPIVDLRSKPDTKGRRIVIYMDNARIHKVERITKMAQAFDVTLLFGAQYSPFTQPIESLFQKLKSDLQRYQAMSTT